MMRIDDYLLKKQRFDLIKEMDALFITAKTKIGQKASKLNIGDNFKHQKLHFSHSTKNF